MRKTLGNFNACPSVFWQKITVPCPDSSNGIGHYARPKAYEMSIADCSPFGVQLDGRTERAERCRYGFYAIKKDDELYGQGNSTTAEFLVANNCKLNIGEVKDFLEIR